jgi:hypothetical protein
MSATKSFIKPKPFLAGKIESPCNNVRENVMVIKIILPLRLEKILLPKQTSTGKGLLQGMSAAANSGTELSPPHGGSSRGGP